jgi:hypothetical protein
MGDYLGSEEFNDNWGKTIYMGMVDSGFTLHASITVLLPNAQN